MALQAYGTSERELSEEGPVQKLQTCVQLFGDEYWELIAEIAFDIK